MKVNLNQTLLGHSGSIYCMAKSTDGIISGGSDGRMVLWKFAHLETGIQLAQIDQPIYCLTEIYPGFIAAGTANGTVYFLNLEEKKVAFTVQLSPKGVFAFNTSLGNILAADADGTLYLIDVKDGRILFQTSITPGKSIRSIDYSIKNKQFLLGTSQFSIHLLDENLIELRKFNGHTGSVFAAKFNPTKTDLFISGGRDARLFLWQIEQDEPLLKIPAHLLHIHHISFSPDAALMVTGSMDKTIKIWDPHELALKKVINLERDKGHSSSVNDCVWLSNNEFVSASDDKSLKHFLINE